MRINQFLDLTHLYMGPEPQYQDIKTAFDNNEKIQCIPLVDETGVLIGNINRSQFNHVDSESFVLSEVVNNLYLFDYNHILEALRELMRSGMEELPVVDDNGFYVGVCHLNDVEHHFQQTMGLLEAGSMLVLQTTVQNYSLVDVAKIVESNQARVLSLYLSTHPDSNQLEITLTLNVSDINDIISTFNRFDYQVNYSSSSSVHDDFLKERYDSLMHFLEI